jgi:colicin import membrane protein
MTTYETIGSLALDSQAPENTPIGEVDAFAAAAGAIRVETPEQYRAAGDFFKDLKDRIKDLEAHRRARVDPINKAIRTINADYKAITDRLEDAAAAVSRRMVAYKRREEEALREAEAKAKAERDRIAAEARERAEAALRAKAEAEARARELERGKASATNAVAAYVMGVEQSAAEEAAAAAHKEAADAIRSAAMTERAPLEIDQRKAAAAGTSYRKVWKFRVTDPALVPREYLCIDEKKLGLVARTEKDQASVPGVEFYADAIIAG